jgi:hypothetical protein
MEDRKKRWNPGTEEVNHISWYPTMCKSVQGLRLIHSVDSGGVMKGGSWSL